MRRLLLSCGLLWIVAVTAASAYPRPPEGTEDVPKLVADSALVCKGEVVSAPKPVLGAMALLPTARATVRMDRCFKGTVSNATVLFDATISPTGPSFILRTGDYWLFF